MHCCNLAMRLYVAIALPVARFIAQFTHLIGLLCASLQKISMSLLAGCACIGDHIEIRQVCPVIVHK